MTIYPVPDAATLYTRPSASKPRRHAFRRTPILAGTLLPLTAIIACGTSSRQAMPTVAKYPEAPRGAVTDTYHGTDVADPYRWLEDPDTPESRRWIDAQNQVTEAYLEQAPAIAPLRDRLTQLWDYERTSVPFRDGGRYFFRKNDGLQAQSVLYTTRDLDAAPQVVLDPNKLSANGTVALQTYSVSHDGKYLAYALADAGSDWLVWHVRDIDSGKDTGDVVKWSKFSSAAWMHDGSGFFYSGYTPPKEGEELEGLNYHQKLYFHRLGTEQSDDSIVYERPEEREWVFDGTVTDDGQFLIITALRGTDDTSMVFYRSLTSPESPVVELLTEFDAEYSFIDNDGHLFWFKTNLNAPRGRVIAIDVNAPARDNWREVIPQTKETLQGVDIVGTHFLALYLKDAQSQLKAYELAGDFVRNVTLPGIGTVQASDGKRSDTETFFAFTSYTRPSTIYRYDVRADVSRIYREPKVDFDPEAYVTKQVFYQSPDGTRVPMFISHKKGLKLTGKLPTYLYGYGGFNIPITPSFSVSTLVWMEQGGVYAVANLRGGGEYGEEWHEAGTRTKKQNVFDDFIAAAEWLIANDYTESSQLAIGGRSNGGLLVAACMIQRPDLFGAVLPAVGVLDMLRFHKFTIGWAWVDDYGSPDDPEEFAALRAYSPVHNVREGVSYPPTLISTADHDDRVVPAHSFKFAAALQAAQGGEAPVLIRIDTQSGHGAGKPTAKTIEELAERMGFLAHLFDMQVD